MLVCMYICVHVCCAKWFYLPYALYVIDEIRNFVCC